MVLMLLSALILYNLPIHTVGRATRAYCSSKSKNREGGDEKEGSEVEVGEEVAKMC
jgi:hypothetical protein